MTALARQLPPTATFVEAQENFRWNGSWWGAGTSASLVQSLRSSPGSVSRPFFVGGSTPAVVMREAPTPIGLEERIFNALVQMKVSVAEFATHLPTGERNRIFVQLDDLINIDDWHAEDELPRPASFRDLLRWAIHSGLYGWTSLGVSDEGTMLVAWKRQDAMLTANFLGDGNVRWTWTARTGAEAEPAHAVGKCALAQFTRQAQFLLTP